MGRGSRGPSPLFVAITAGLCLACGTACAVPDDSDPDRDALKTMLETLGEFDETALYAAAAVDTPDGLWNVYVVSAPPDQVAVRQARQTGEVEYGMRPDRIWLHDYGTGRTRDLSEEWRYFIRTQELFRLGNRIRRWTLRPDAEKSEACTGAPGAERCVAFDDEFDRSVEIAVGRDGRPVRILLDPPARYGTGTVTVTPEKWRDREGRLLLTKYEYCHAGRCFDWRFEGIDPIQNQDAVLHPPGE